MSCVQNSTSGCKYTSSCLDSSGNTQGVQTNDAYCIFPYFDNMFKFSPDFRKIRKLPIFSFNLGFLLNLPFCVSPFHHDSFTHHAETPAETPRVSKPSQVKYSFIV